jgi:membrane protein
MVRDWQQFRGRLIYWREHGRLFLVFLLARIQSDRISMMAGSLAYVTLLSLVPLVAVTFAVMSAFPVFSGLQGQVEDFVFSNFVPASGAVVKEQIRGFVGNASKMTAVGISALFVVAIMLIAAIDNSLNSIWRSAERRRWVQALPIYWMILTLGPLLVGGSLAVSSYILSLQLFTDGALVSVWSRLLRLLPLGFSVLAFSLLYLLVPNKRVRVSHALSGALLAASLFELCKRGFALYISSFPSYQLIYGALAAIPILFVWVYLSWIVVLLGAEWTAAMDEYEVRHPDEPESLEGQKTI